MDSGPGNTKRLAALTEEINAIHFADKLYWRQGDLHSKDAMAEYERRQNRLAEIREEMTAFCSVKISPLGSH